MMNTIDLDAALELIRSVQQDVMNSGYYLALAGGGSNNDLDLVAVPREGYSNIGDLYYTLHNRNWVLDRITYQSRNRRIDIAHYTINGIKVDLAIVL